MAIEYEKIEKHMVPDEERLNKSSKYGGLYLFFKTTDLNENFKLVHKD